MKCLKLIILVWILIAFSQLSKNPDKFKIKGLTFNSNFQLRDSIYQFNMEDQSSLYKSINIEIPLNKGIHLNLGVDLRDWQIEIGAQVGIIGAKIDLNGKSQLFIGIGKNIGFGKISLESCYSLQNKDKFDFRKLPLSENLYKNFLNESSLNDDSWPRLSSDNPYLTNGLKKSITILNSDNSLLTNGLKKSITLTNNPFAISSSSDFFPKLDLSSSQWSWKLTLSPSAIEILKFASIADKGKENK